MKFHLAILYMTAANYWLDPVLEGDWLAIVPGLGMLGYSCWFMWKWVSQRGRTR